MIRLDMHLYCICIYTHTLSIQGVKFGKCMRGNERQISGREKREVEKTATVACNGSFLSGVVQVGAGRRGVRSVGFLFTLQRLDIHRYREDLLYEYCGSRPGVAQKWLLVRAFQFAYSLFSNRLVHATTPAAPYHLLENLANHRHIFFPNQRS